MKTFSITLDKPRNLYLTNDSTAKVEEERGVSFFDFCKQPPGGDPLAYLADMLWAFNMADDPQLTPLEARKIIRMCIVNAPPFLKAKRIRDLRDAVLAAGKAYEKEFLSGLKEE